jgi:hypothetical protein
MRALICAVLAIASLGASCTREPGPSATSASPGDVAIQLAPLSAELSEPSGYFDTDNLISNETSYLQVAESLADSAPKGGVYIGVGPDQNFTYIARVRPALRVHRGHPAAEHAQHLLFAALLAQANDPYQYLCLLFSARCPPPRPKARARDRRRAEGPGGAEAVGARLRRQPGGRLPAHRGTLKFPLRAKGPHGHPEHLPRLLRRAGGDPLPDVRAHVGHVPPDLPDAPERAQPRGRFGSFLSSREDYDFVRGLSRAQRIVPVVGDFAGPEALRGIGRWVREHGLTVSAFYTSNVEFYLVRNRVFDRFVANVKELPHAPDSVIIRACFDYGRSHPLEIPGHRSVLLLQRLPRFLELYDAGSYSSDWDVCTADYLH